MYRLLIVDDERYITESLVELFSAQRDMNLEITAAYYGDEALYILQSQKVDIILLDIKMPGMSGIEVARKIVADWPLCKIIFLTGYASFDYIYEIEQMANTSFLLKTEDNAAIVSAVRRAIDEIEEQKRYRQLSIQARQAQIQMEYLLHADLLRDLANGRSLIDLHDALRQTGDSFPFDTSRALCLLYLKVKWNSLSDSQMDFHQRIAALTAYFGRCLNEKYTVFLLDLSSDTFLIFLQPACSEPLQGIDQLTYIRECLNDCISSPKPNPDCQLLLLIHDSDIPWSKISQACNFFHQYDARVVHPTSRQYGKILFCQDEDLSRLHPEYGFPDISAAQKPLSLLAFGLHSGNEKNIRQALQSLEKILSSIKSMHHLAAINLYHKIADLFIEFILQHHLTEKIALQIGLYMLYEPGQFQSWSDFTDYCHKLSSLLLQAVSSQELDGREQIVSQIRAYVQNNLQKSLSLTEISNSVNYNSTYVSRLFRQMTGENLSDYILRTRMTKAMEYLTQGNESIQAIAEKLGFDTSQYFSYVFRKHTGFSPREYRNRSFN